MTPPMRIALIASNRFTIRQPFAGGLEAHVWHLARALADAGHQVSLFASPGSDPSLDCAALPAIASLALGRSPMAAHILVGTTPVRTLGVQIDKSDVLELAYADGTFDAAVSTQVYEYVPDLPRALDELHRVLRPGGRALVLDTDWDSLMWHTSDRGLNRRITAAWDEHLVHPHLPKVLARLMRGAGFTVTVQPGARAVQHRAHRELVQCVRHARGRATPAITA